MGKQRFINNFDAQFAAPVKATATTGDPDNELDYGILRLNSGAASFLGQLTNDDWYVVTGYKKSGSVESNVEIMKILAIDNSIINEFRIYVQRGQEGTQPQAYMNGDYVGMRYTAGTAANLLQIGEEVEMTPAVTTALAGKVDKVSGKGLSAEDYSTAEKTKLAGIAAGAQVNVATNLGLGTATATTQPLTSSTGGGVTLPSASTASAGLMAASDKVKLNGVAAGATANATDAQLRDRSTHTGITPLTGGGTGAGTAEQARVNLGLKSAAVADILGTVSQTGGVPTGAIIQRGSNANGEFVRFADGTQICSFRMPITQFTTSAPPTGTVVGTWTFPASFVSSPLAFFRLDGAYSSAVNVSPDSSSTTGTTGIYATGVAAGIVVYGPMVCMAIGRWF